MTITDEIRSGTGTTHQIGMFADRLTGIVHAFAQPSLVQLVMRLALAVPFWRSGINKWDGFLQLKDTTVLLFSEEFMLHLPGGPYHYPAPAVFAFVSGCGEILFPILLVFGLATRFPATPLLFMTCIFHPPVPTRCPFHFT